MEKITFRKTLKYRSANLVKPAANQAFKDSFRFGFKDTYKKIIVSILTAIFSAVVAHNFDKLEGLSMTILEIVAVAIGTWFLISFAEFVAKFIHNLFDAQVSSDRALFASKSLEEIMLKLKEFRRSGNDLSEKYAIDSTKIDQDYTSWKKEVEDFLKDRLNDSWVDKFNGIDCSITDTLMSFDLADNARDSLFGGTPRNPNLAPNNIAFHLKKRIHSLSAIIDDLLPRTIPLKEGK